IRLDRSRSVLQHRVYYFAEPVEGMHVDYKHLRIFLDRHEAELDLAHDAERSLRPYYKLGEVKRALLPVPYVPQQIPGRVLGHVRLCLLDNVVVVVEELEDLPVDLTFQVFLRELGIELLPI